MAGVAGRHHQVHHRLHLGNLLGLDELHDAQFTLSGQSHVSQTEDSLPQMEEAEYWHYLLQLLGGPLRLPDHPLGGVDAHPWRRLGETLTPAGRCSVPSVGGGGRRGGRRTSRGFVQHKPTQRRHQVKPSCSKRSRDFSS